MKINDPLRTAKNLYEKHGGDFDGHLAWFVLHGVVISTPTTFLMGYFFRDDHDKPVTQKDATGFFVDLCAGCPKSALHQLVDLVPVVAYVRTFRGDSRIRITNIKKLYSKL